MSREIFQYAVMIFVALGMSAVAQAQTESGEAQTQGSKVIVTGGPETGQDNHMGIFRRNVYAGRAGSFAFEGIVGGFGGKVVTGAPFSAQVTRTTHQVLADGTQINRTETGSIARDSAGRTRHEIILPAIGPLINTSGQVPHIVFIRDPAAGKGYVLNENKKTALTINLPIRANGRPGRMGGAMRMKMNAQFKANVQQQSLGTKTMDGLTVQGTQYTRTIPAGRIGNDKPIVITTEEWYSPQLQMVVSRTRTDPRFGTTTYQLSNVSLNEPPQSMFIVPSDYTPAKGRMMFRKGGARAVSPLPPPDGD
ncbi:MAG TPA: hypothetical protein VKS20_10285 [Candidatus Acidoferrales bacterium]|nr:hypothetical protein [Candidatus Acidoferrales bacterium]